MIHFAYPNVSGKNFLGCGRFVALPSSQGQAPEGYTVAKPNTPSLSKVLMAAELLARESGDASVIVYEKKKDDGSTVTYKGSSLDLAFFLALISRSQRLGLGCADNFFDIWCTGTIDLEENKRPFLKTVSPNEFEAKLEAFLQKSNKDMLFFVPAANLSQQNIILCQNTNVRVLSLFELGSIEGYRKNLFQNKTIVKVQRYDLDLLVQELFEPPNLILELTRYLQNLITRLGSLPWFYPQDIPLELVHIPMKVSQERLQYGTNRSGRTGNRHRNTAILDELNEAEAYRVQPQRSVVREWGLVREEILQRGAPYGVILGHPGFGKTHLLHVEARNAAQRSLKHLQEEGLEGVGLPVFVRLVDLAAYEGEIEDRICAFLRKEYDLSESVLVWVRSKLLTRDCVLLLDGWDELSLSARDFEDPTSLSCHLERFARLSSSYIFLTSRLTGYNRAPPFLRGRVGQEFELIAFEPEQVDQYINAWFQEQPEKKKRLSQGIRQSPQLMGLACNPLLLSFVCLLFQEDEASLPTRRAALYEECLYGLLQRWQVTRRRQHVDRVYVDAKIELLGEIALAALQERERSLTVDFLRRQVEAVLNRLAPAHPLYGRKSNDIIAELIHQDGVLVEAGSHETAHVLFLHPTFQEYLAALALVHREDVLEEVSRHLWASPEWAEVIVLCAAMMRRPQELIERILVEPDDIFHTGLFHAGRCLTECGENELSHKLVQRLWNEVFRLLDKAPHLRREVWKLLAAMARSNRTCMHRLNGELKSQKPRKILKLLGVLKELNTSRPELVADLLDPQKNRQSISFYFELTDVLSSLGWFETLTSLHTSEGIASDALNVHLRELLTVWDSDPTSEMAIMDDIFRRLLFFSIFQNQSLGTNISLHFVEMIRLAAQTGWSYALVGFLKYCLGFTLGALVALITGTGAAIREKIALLWRSLRLPSKGRTGRPLASRVVICMTHPYPWVRIGFLEDLRLSRNTDDLVLAMLQVVARRDDNLLVRLYAGYALIELERATPDVVSGLFEAVRHEDSVVREHAVEILAKVSGFPSLLAQFEAIGDKCNDVSEKAVKGLIKPLRTILRDNMDELIKETREIYTAEEFKQAFGTEGSLRIDTSLSMFSVIQLCLDKGDQEDTSILQTILRTVPQVVAVLYQVIKKQRKGAEEQTIGCYEYYATPVCEPFWERMRSLEKLGAVKVANCQILNTLIETIRDDHNIWVCMKAINILQRFAPLDPQTITNLLQVYPHESDEVSEKVIEALGQSGYDDHPGLIDVLIKTLQQDRTPQVRGAAARILRAVGRTDTEIVSVLIEALDDEDAQVRREAAKTLGELGDDDTLMQLCQLWNKIPEGRREGLFLALSSVSYRSKQKLWQKGRRRHLSLVPVISRTL